MDKNEIIAEIKRVARGANSLSQREFEQRANIGLTTVRYAFGSWNQAIKAAGFIPNPPGGSVLRSYAKSDDLYLQEIIRLTKLLGKTVTESEMNAKGNFSTKPFRDRWGTFSKARDVAYKKYGFPILEKEKSSS